MFSADFASYLSQQIDAPERESTQRKEARDTSPSTR